MKDEKEINIFEQFGFYYDKMIPWEKRLKNEEPFFRHIVEEKGAESLLDVGCGTGRHALMFAKLGLQVLGVDPSAEMITVARKNALGEAVEVEFQELGMGRLRELKGNFDVITCLGNSLAHMRDRASLENAVGGFYDSVSQNGALVIQMRNYDKVFLNRERFMPLNSYGDDQQEILFLRMTDLIDELQVNFSILIFHRKQGGEWKFEVLTEPLTPWRQEHLTEVLQKAGFKNIQTYGNYQRAPWSRKDSADLIITAEK